MLQIHRDHPLDRLTTFGLKSIAEAYAEAHDAEELREAFAAAKREGWRVHVIGGGSRNHHMFSDVSAFFYKYIAGITPAAPGYRTVLLRPACSPGGPFSEERRSVRRKKAAFPQELRVDLVSRAASMS